MSRRPFSYVIAFGIALGWWLPNARHSQGAPAVAAITVPPAPPPRAPGDPPPPLDTVIQRGPGGHFYVDAEVNGQMVRFVVDTGATVVALTAADAQRIGVPFDRSQFTIVGSGASGPVMGEKINISHIRIDQKEEYDVPGVVLDDGLNVSLLGQSFLARIQSVSIDGDQMTMR